MINLVQNRVAQIIIHIPCFSSVLPPSLCSSSSNYFCSLTPSPLLKYRCTSVLEYSCNGLLEYSYTE